VIGVKARAAGTATDEKESRYLVDRLEVNALIPNLVCEFPCEHCAERDLFNLRVRDYCTSCW